MSYLLSLLLLLTQTNLTQSDLIERSKEVAQTLEARKYEAVAAQFDEAMQKALPTSSLGKTWDVLHKQLGSLKKTGKSRQVKADPYEVVFIECEFERGTLELKLVYDKAEKISGMAMLPAGTYALPKYAQPSETTTRQASIGKGLLNLPGTLMLPKTASAEAPVPVVLLVHGSGPQDRDETIGPNKPFLDLSHGLAARGVAVLRYEKRTRHYASMLALQASSLTVKQETIDDVVFAVNYLKSQPEIDKNRIYIAGHSLGGMLTPRIAAKTPDAAGYISLAGSSRPLEDSFLEQALELITKQPTLSDEEQAEVESLKKKVAMVKSPELKRETPASELPLGIPAAYWLDLRGYKPAEEAKSITKPLLMIHCGRDYQVTQEDWKLWEAALSELPNCTLRVLPKLNHLFMAGEGRSTPKEYLEVGHVDEELIEVIEHWVKAR